jgi:ferritin-like metal-binding protein YciE
MTRTTSDQLTKYLTDAHAIERQALAQLRAAPKLARDDAIAEAYTVHLQETEGHAQRIEQLLADRDAHPSRIEDAAMALGGKGFVLFARSQPDTPGKLQSHAYSYEALELASYRLLERVAERAGEQEVADAAQAIAAQERAMLERLGGLFDHSTDASLAGPGKDDLMARVRAYLADAHALEMQAIDLLQRGEKLAGGDALAGVYRDHLSESRGHADLIEQRLRTLGGEPSAVKDAALRLGALNWAAFFAAQPDTPGKLAAFVFAFEHLEAGGYEQLRRVAERAGDRETAELARRILGDERRAAEKVAALFDDAADASLEAVGATE